MTTQKETNDAIAKAVHDALTMIDIGQSFVLANSSTAGMLRDLEKLVPELENLKQTLALLPSRMLQEGRIQPGSLWKNKDTEVRVVGLANVDSSRLADYPVLVFHTPINRKEERGQNAVRSTPIEDWEEEFSLVSLPDPEACVENVLAILEAMTHDIAQAHTLGDDYLNIRSIAHRLRSPVLALRAMVPMLLDRCLPDGDDSCFPDTGSEWTHRNGNRYTVIGSSDAGQRVVYRGDNGKVWARLLSDWHRSMSPIHSEGALKLCASTRLK